MDIGIDIDTGKQITQFSPKLKSKPKLRTNITNQNRHVHNNNSKKKKKNTPLVFFAKKDAQRSPNI